jgi:hypothetical protein
MAAAYEAVAAWANGRPSCRPLFQKKLADAKIAWETQAEKYVADRTTLDDLAYAVMHCPEIVTAEFRDRAYAHAKTYDLIFYAPLSAGQWLANDPSRVADPLYHWRYDVLLQGLMQDADVACTSVVPLPATLEDRYQIVRTAIRWTREG